MIQETLQKIQATLSASKLEETEKKELTQLLDSLQKEVLQLAETHSEDAHSVVHFTQATTHEAVKENQNPALLDLSLKGLSLSVQKLEASHPQLVSIVNSICNSLANSGF